jgi:hypothetical protein
MASSVKDGAEVIHTDGRRCIYKGGSWLANDALGGTYKLCERAHHPWASDRGDFGMPGVGKLGDMFEGPAWAERDAQSDDKPSGTDTMKVTSLPPKMITEWPTMTVINDELVVDYGEQGYSIPIPTADARYILMLLPDILAQFLEKNAKYAMVEQGYDLGDAGIIPDLNRKLGILIKRLWARAEFDEREESTDEVIGDMIGHLLLMLAKRRGQ